MPYGFVATSSWGEGDGKAEYAVGDVVYVAPGCAAVIDKRCREGLHRVEACFSIGEDASFYYRIARAAIIGAKGAIRIVTDWEETSDRIHVIPGRCDYTAGWVKLYAAGAEQ